MGKKFHYSLKDKFLFYLSYFWYKLILPFEVKKPKWKMWWYEFIYTVLKFKDYTICSPWKYPQDMIETKFGIFKIRKNTADAANISPAFERRDQNLLIRLLKKHSDMGKKILFLDIGGDIGTYSILVANKFTNRNLSVKCFEPVEESCKLIKENLKLNNIEDRVTLYPVGLLDKNDDNSEIELNTDAPGSSTMKSGENSNYTKIKIKTRKLDDLIGDEISGFDTIVFKIDVEGVEREVLEGAVEVLNSGKDIYLMVEDFIDSEITKYLHEHGWSFMGKATTYNSWWSYKKS